MINFTFLTESKIDHRAIEKVAIKAAWNSEVYIGDVIETEEELNTFIEYFKEEVIEIMEEAKKYPDNNPIINKRRLKK